MHAEGNAVVSALARLFGAANGGEALPLSGIRERASKELSQFARIVREELDTHGISIPPAISLVSHPDCVLAVEGDHPQRAAIQTWLSDNHRITKYFKEVEVLFEVVRAAENAGEVFPEHSCFHVGLTSAGPVAYFDDHR
ncbi:hypothetical protein [Vogesella oryzae]|uniref:hypothetical protein n=1 Tax=Vogesella oryzae TaxID=1735285 RepID=UPI0015833356|nr:hypothetical protein [Vogesella oryzae]